MICPLPTRIWFLNGISTALVSIENVIKCEFEMDFNIVTIIKHQQSFICSSTLLKKRKGLKHHRQCCPVNVYSIISTQQITHYDEAYCNA